MNYLFLIFIFVEIAAPNSFAKNSQVQRAFSPEDAPSLLDPSVTIENNLYTLDSSLPRSLDLGVKPWTTPSWSMEKGLIGNRYRDGGYSRRLSWTHRYEYIQRNPASAALREPSPTKRAKLIDDLSPAEKYDLLVGDDQFSLTAAQWISGAKYHDNGTMAHWMGICEGSSAASVFFPEPRRNVELESPQGDKIVFYNTDIKGLASLLWSAYNVDLPVAGHRCDSRTPRESEACFDNNPATFHLALLNFVGAQRQPLFMNRSLKLEVWNVPIISYEIQYLDQNGRPTNTLQEALVAVDTTSADSSYRAPQTKNLIAVRTVIHFGSSGGGIKQATYNYDLELGSEGQILGGEWFDLEHPDFLWTVKNGFKPLSTGDQQLQGQTWSGEKIPTEWLPAIRMSARKNQPLELIVNELVRRAKE